MRRKIKKSHDAPKKSRFADEIMRTLRGNWVQVLKLYSDGMVQAVTFTYLVYW